MDTTTFISLASVLVAAASLGYTIWKDRHKRKG